MEFAERMQAFSKAASGVFSPLHSYTVVSLFVQGLAEPEFAAMVTHHGKAIRAKRVCGVIAGEHSGTVYMVTTPMDAFAFRAKVEAVADRLYQNVTLKDWEVCFYGKLQDYMVSPIAEPDEVARVERTAWELKQ